MALIERDDLDQIDRIDQGHPVRSEMLANVCLVDLFRHAFECWGCISQTLHLNMGCQPLKCQSYTLHFLQLVSEGMEAVKREREEGSFN